MIATDILVVGSGIAALSFAVRMAKAFTSLEVSVLTKQELTDSSTHLAQGGIAIAIDADLDSLRQHVKDTLRAGDGLCDETVVEAVISAGPECLHQLLQWGIDFDRDAHGSISLGKEGGHSVNRIVHFKDITGKHITEGLLRYLRALPNVKIYEHHQVLDLIVRREKCTKDKVCLGMYVLDVKLNIVRTFSGRATILATGGIGQIYKKTTNPRVATGDGIAMAYRAGAEIREMEFIQFHPTSLNAGGNPAFLISEALRGFGAHLRNAKGERFTLQYDQRGELASRDIISKAIYHQLAIDPANTISLDCRHLDSKQLRLKFPTIFEHCLLKGFDLTKEVIPVTPAAHYLCGGVAVDLNGETSIENLFACGECSRTGLHGANRLASNSLLEALAYSLRIYQYLEQRILFIPRPNFNDDVKFPTRIFYQDAVVASNREVLRETMDSSAGIVRTNHGMKKGMRLLEALENMLLEMYITTFPSVALVELMNMTQVSKLILQQSLDRVENRGTFFNVDLK